jgi:hypothetical protein
MPPTIKRKALKERQDKELGDFKQLMQKADRWQRLKLIRGYIDELEAKSIEMALLTDEVKEWITWARKKADWYDPQVNAPDELLQGVDRDTLMFRGRELSLVARWI